MKLKINNERKRKLSVLLNVEFLFLSRPFFTPQVRFFVKSLLGLVQLPARDVMLADTAREAAWRKEELLMPDRYFHR